MFSSPLCTALHRSQGGTLGHRCNHSPGWPSLPGPQPLERHPFSGVGGGVSGPSRIIISSEPLKHKPWQITDLLLSLPPLDSACLWSPPASPRQLCRLHTAPSAPSSHMLQSYLSLTRHHSTSLTSCPVQLPTGESAAVVSHSCRWGGGGGARYGGLSPPPLSTPTTITRPLNALKQLGVDLRDWEKRSPQLGKSHLAVIKLCHHAGGRQKGAHNGIRIVIN